MIEESLLRILTSFIVGFILSGSGSFSQILSHNPLASPSTLGITSLVLILQILLFVSFGELHTLTLLMIFHLIFVAFYFYFSKKQLSFKEENVFSKAIIIGLCINLLAGALYSLVQFIMLNIGEQFPSELWFGHFKFIERFEFFFVLILFLFCFVKYYELSKKLRWGILGKGFALSFQKDFDKYEKQTYLLLIYAVSICTIFFGIFSFIGLIFPHILRNFPFIKQDLRKEVMLGGLISGAFFSIIDFFCFHFPVNGSEVSIGLVTSLAGPLLFIGIILRKSIKKI